jgi:hypothetical protein
MLLLDDTSAEVLVADKALPPSAATLHRALVDAWPRLDGRVTFLSADVGDVPLRAGDVVASIHACGALTDVVLRRAMEAGARVAVVPCCHHLRQRDSSDLSGWLDGPTAIDVMRAARLKEQGHRVWTLTIPDTITPHNRLLLAE